MSLSASTVQEIELCLPKLGESILTATVVQWLKKEGDFVSQDEPLVEVSTDKVNSEIPSPTKGRLIKILAKVDQDVEVGGVLAIIETGEGVEEQQEKEPTYSATPHQERATVGFLTPAVLRLVRECGIPLEELESITGSGEGNRITKRDVEAYASARGNLSKKRMTPGCGEVERVVMSPMRKAIADNMSRSKREIPHGYFVSEVDVTQLVDGITAKKEAFISVYGVKLTITSFIVSALAKAAAEFNAVNAEFQDGAMFIYKSVNVGVAVSVEQGLVVPVIKACHQLSVVEIAKEIVRLSKRARARELDPDDVVGGTITLTNFGTSGIQIGIPIIRHPESAIIAVGTIDKKVMVDENDQFVVRKVIHAALSFDHRAVDGMYASGFLARFKEILENPPSFDELA